jgi:hypothetical protein
MCLEKANLMTDSTPKNQQSWMDQHMQSIIGDGNVSHLKGSGKRLALDEDTHTPETQRMATRVMKENNVLPGWMQMGQDLENERDGLLSRLNRMARTYKGQLADAERAGKSDLILEIEAWWQTACQRVREQVKEYNRRLLTFNITLPQGFEQRLQLQAEDEIRKALTRRDGSIDIRIDS